MCMLVRIFWQVKVFVGVFFSSLFFCRSFFFPFFVLFVCHIACSTRAHTPNSHSILHINEAFGAMIARCQRLSASKEQSTVTYSLYCHFPYYCVLLLRLSWFVCSKRLFSRFLFRPISANEGGITLFLKRRKKKLTNEGKIKTRTFFGMLTIETHIFITTGTMNKADNHRHARTHTNTQNGGKHKHIHCTHNTPNPMNGLLSLTNVISSLWAKMMEMMLLWTLSLVLFPFFTLSQY